MSKSIKNDPERQVMIILPKSEWEAHQTKIDELKGLLKNTSPLENYITKEAFEERFGISDATFYRLRSSGKINVKKLGGLQLVYVPDLIKAIEIGDI